MSCRDTARRVRYQNQINRQTKSRASVQTLCLSYEGINFTKYKKMENTGERSLEAAAPAALTAAAGGRNGRTAADGSAVAAAAGAVLTCKVGRA